MHVLYERLVRPVASPQVALCQVPEAHTEYSHTRPHSSEQARYILPAAGTVFEVIVQAARALREAYDDARAPALPGSPNAASCAGPVRRPVTSQPKGPHSAGAGCEALQRIAGRRCSHKGHRGCRPSSGQGPSRMPHTTQRCVCWLGQLVPEGSCRAIQAVSGGSCGTVDCGLRGTAV
jgi:hypothetical protein